MRFAKKRTRAFLRGQTARTGRSLVKDKATTDLLFRTRGPHARQYWWRKVQQYCEQAGVPKVCPHSLRGLHATLAIEEGATSEAVARALGHTSFAMTAKHYARPDSVINARVARAGQLLTPIAAELAPDQVDHWLSRLTPEQMENLRSRLIH